MDIESQSWQKLQLLVLRTFGSHFGALFGFRQGMFSGKIVALDEPSHAAGGADQGGFTNQWMP